MDVRMKPRTLICCFLCLVIAAACSAEEPSEKGNSYALWKQQPDEHIVFMSRADSPQGELYLLDKRGMITRLTENERHENNPALSLDGKKVAFHGGDEGNPLTWEIYTLDLETEEETQLTDNGVIDAHPDWSPDGTRIVFGSFRDGHGNPTGTADLYLMDTDDGEGLSRLTDSPWEDNDPEWSPDGSMIAFKSTRRTRQRGREEIFVVNSDGADPQRLTTSQGWGSDHDPSWSPDSNYVVFNRFEGDRSWLDTAEFARDWRELTPWNVHRVDLQGVVERLTDNAEAGWGVALYSTTGDHILYGRIDWITDEEGRVVGGFHRLILMGSDGSDPSQLLPDDEHTGTLEYFDW